MTHEDPLNHVLKARLVYHLPDEDHVTVIKNVPFTTVNDLTLYCDIYTPHTLSPTETRPGVLFVSGDTPHEYMLGVKDWGVYVSWGRLVAAAGFIGITFQHRVMEQLQAHALDAVVADVDAAIAFVRHHATDFSIDPERLCLWSGSAGAIPGMHVGLRGKQPFLRCLVSYYGLFDLAVYAQARQLALPPPAVLQRFAPIAALHERVQKLPPVLIARMAHDLPGLNTAVDQFIATAHELDAPVSVLYHSEGHHGFDTEDDTDQSRAIIQQTLAFMHHHLDC